MLLGFLHDGSGPATRQLRAPPNARARARTPLEMRPLADQSLGSNACQYRSLVNWTASGALKTSHAGKRGLDISLLMKDVDETHVTTRRRTRLTARLQRTATHTHSGERTAIYPKPARTSASRHLADVHVRLPTGPAPLQHARNPTPSATDRHCPSHRHPATRLPISEAPPCREVHGRSAPVGLSSVG